MNLHAVTIASNGYQAHAIVAGESFLRHNPNARFTVVTIDCPSEPFLRAGLEVIPDTSLTLGNLAARRSRYNDFEYATSLKASAMIATHSASDIVVFLDADIYVVAAFDALAAALDDCAVLVTPHLREVPPDDGRWPDTRSILSVGVINSGFVAVRGDEDGLRFLVWWSDRLERDCRATPKRGLYVDQRWLDLALTLFPEISLDRDGAWNLGHWNLAGANLRMEDGVWMIKDQDLRTFHFSGFDPHRPASISRHQNRLPEATGLPVGALCSEYAAALLAAGYDRFTEQQSFNHRAKSLGHLLMPVAKAAAPLRKRLGRT